MYEFNPIRETDEHLSQKLSQLQECLQPWQKNPDRLRNIKSQMAYIVFEQMSRYQERRPYDTSEQDSQSELISQ